MCILQSNKSSKMTMYESDIEQIALDVLRDDNGYIIRYGPDLAEGPAKERDHSETILATRLRAAIDRFNPTIPASARAEAYKKVLRADALTLLDNNEGFYRLLTDGIDIMVECVRKNTSIDWPLKESVQAKLRVLVKRILRKYKYPPDDPATGEYTESVNKVLDQAALLADFWTTTPTL